MAALEARNIQLSPSIAQDDQAYAPAGWRYGDSKLGVCFARLRTQAGRHLFTVKRPVDNELSCIEHETEVANRQATHDAIVAMGFYSTVRIHKTRRTSRLGDLSICVDEVTGIGCFLEVETMSHDGSAGLAEQRAMRRFVEQLGVEVEETIATYDSLVWQAQLASA